MMGPDERRIAEQIARTPPACIREFVLEPADVVQFKQSYFSTAYRLKCTCQCDSGEILGYPLRTLNPRTTGPEFAGPIAFSCERCGKTTEVIDTKDHGYHAEVAKREGGTGSAKIRGSGPRVTFACPACAATHFVEVTAEFAYWHFDIIFDEPSWPGEDFFNEFVIVGKCRACAQISSMTNFGKL
jgi:hypothetical protein